jgi:hypothetical protein
MASSGTFTQETLHKEFLELVRDSPNDYLTLDEEYQSDPEICLATLLSYEGNNDDHGGEILIEIFEIVVSHLPNFADHRLAFLRFVQLGDSQPIEMYFDHFAPEIQQNREFLKEALAYDGRATLFQLLSVELRSDPELLMVSVKNVSSARLFHFVHSVPPEALALYEFIPLLALDRNAFFLPRQVPPSFWENRKFVMKWIEKDRDISPIPRAFSSDREICLCLYQTWAHRPVFWSVIDWMAKSLLADKEFVLECLGHHPAMFGYCAQELQDDFDVQLDAAYRAVIMQFALLESTESLGDYDALSPERRLFIIFLERLGASRVNAFRSRLEAHDEFMTFLACSWKNRQVSRLSLSGLDCDDETARGLKTMIGRYLGFSGTRRLERLQRVWDEIVFLALRRSDNLSYELLPFVPSQTLVQSVLKAIECHRLVSLATYPDELWTNRLFVNWAAKKGMINKAISDEFSSDPEICFAYYKYSPAVREATLPWISEILKSNQDFVLRCVRISPLILNYCKTDEILYDFEVLQVVAGKAVAKDEVDDLAIMALKNGWAEALSFFAKSLHANIQDLSAVEAFGDQGGTLYFEEAVAAVKPLIGSFLGIVPDGRKLYALQKIWNHRSIFFLSLGGNVIDLCKASKFRAKRKQEANY